jgi:hypothetical protein
VTGPEPPTVRGLLDADLAAARRREHLDELCGHFTGEPLDVTVAGLHEVLADRIDIEDFRRLNILISHLVNQCGASISLNRKLRAEVHAAFSRRGEPVSPHPEGGDLHVMQGRGLP